MAFDTDFPKILGIGAGLTLVVGFAAKYLLKDWQEKSKELENLKAKNTSTAINKLEEDQKKFNTTVQELRIIQERLIGRLDKSDKTVEALQLQMNRTMDKLEGFTRDLKTHITQAVKTELVELSSKATLVRNKKQ